MTSTLNFSIPVTEGNLEDVNQIVALVAKVTTSAMTDDTFKDNQSYQTIRDEPSNTPENVVETEVKETTSKYKMSHLSTAIKNAKDRVGAEAVHKIFDEFEVPANTAIGKRKAAVDPVDYGELIGLLNDAQPKNSQNNTDGKETMPDRNLIVPEEVKNKIMASVDTIGRDDMKTMMDNCKIESLSKIGNATQEGLAKMLKEIENKLYEIESKNTVDDDFGGL